ncbi:MAG: ClpXP protease specificity-enhancing factor [Thiomonas sp.]
MDSAHHTTSTKPYLIRALYEWCTDNGLTPYIAVRVGAGARVPMEFVKNGEIVFNISFDATSGLHIGNDDIRFKARFGGVARDILIPIGQVTAIYARETSQGMAFPAETDHPQPDADHVDASTAVDQHEQAPGATSAAAPARLRPVESASTGQTDSTPDEPPPSAPRPGGARLTRVK